MPRTNTPQDFITRAFETHGIPWQVLPKQFNDPELIIGCIETNCLAVTDTGALLSYPCGYSDNDDFMVLHFGLDENPTPEQREKSAEVIASLVLAWYRVNGYELDEVFNA